MRGAVEDETQDGSLAQALAIGPQEGYQKALCPAAAPIRRRVPSLTGLGPACGARLQQPVILA